VTKFANQELAGNLRQRAGFVTRSVSTTDKPLANQGGDAWASGFYISALFGNRT